MSSAKPAFRFRDCCTSRPNSGFRQCRSRQRFRWGEVVANDRGHVSTMADVASIPRYVRSGIPPNRFNGPTAPQVNPDQLRRAHPVAQAPSSGLPENHTNHRKNDMGAHPQSAAWSSTSGVRPPRYTYSSGVPRVRPNEIGHKSAESRVKSGRAFPDSGRSASGIREWRHVTRRFRSFQTVGSASGSDPDFTASDSSSSGLTTSPSSPSSSRSSSMSSSTASRPSSSNSSSSL